MLCGDDVHVAGSVAAALFFTTIAVTYGGEEGLTQGIN